MEAFYSVCRWCLAARKRQPDKGFNVIGVGILGALIGGGLLRAAGIDNDDTRFLASIGTAIIGAVLLLLVLQALAGRAARSRRRR